MPIKLTDAIKDKIEKCKSEHPDFTTICAFLIVRKQFEFAFDSVYDELLETGAINSEDEKQSDAGCLSNWNDGESDAEYCTKRFGEDFDYLR